jgi:ATP-dependent Lhr-like helicase
MDRMSAYQFHPVVARWFEEKFGAPTEPQERGWPAIQSGAHTLIAAPTGSGKTLAAFFAELDQLFRDGLAGKLADATRVLYVSPLKALSNDIHKNLEEPLAGIRKALLEATGADVDVRGAVRTGDTPASRRQAMGRKPPHILVTTPESMYLLLTSVSGRKLLATVRTLIVDEIHAVVGNRRGSHLALSIERLAALVKGPLQRIGLSATQRPIDEVARFLAGTEGAWSVERGERGASRTVQRSNASTLHAPHDPAPACTVIDLGYRREMDLGIEVPGSPLEAVMSNEVWAEVYTRLAELVAAHRTTLVFVNTRRLAERVTRHLCERLGQDKVASHHGSLSAKLRLEAENRLKRGELKALVATASLELGIDIGSVDLVCQLGPTRSIATLLQRVGRAEHKLGGLPKGRIFPLSRDELVECLATVRSVRNGQLDALVIPQKPLDVLAQQIVACAACEEWDETKLFALVRSAYPYRNLAREKFDEVVRMLAEGFSTKRGRRGALLHHDAVNQRLRGRRGARLVALTSGGAIPDTGDYRVVLEPSETFIGTVNEDFAVESAAGDVFQLGNASWRILRINTGTMRVADAQGQPPNIPFWLGEAPGRTDEVSWAVSELRVEVERAIRDASNSPDHELEGRARLFSARREVEPGTSSRRAEDRRALPPASVFSDLPESAGRQLADYFAASYQALGALPSQETLIIERFFDESGGMQLVIHSPFGIRINRAWGLALRKRFCRSFNFELQAAATDDAIVLSLGTQHSFPLEEVFHYLNSKTVRDLLVQALLDAPMFPVRWRWNAGRALALPRQRGGRKLATPLQRMEAENLLAAVFPDQLACLENIVGDRQVPDHPLVRQTVEDCLTEAMDIDGLIAVLRKIETGQVRCLARELPEPSPMAHEILNARPYAFLDNAPLEERRTQAVYTRRASESADAELGILDAAAIEKVCAEAWPRATNPDELHEALLLSGVMTEAEARGVAPEAGTWLEVLGGERRAGRLANPGPFWIAAERLPLVEAVYPGAHLESPLVAPESASRRKYEREEALRELVRGRVEISGPLTTGALANLFQVAASEIEGALLALEAEGFVLRGKFHPGTPEVEWCDRRLLARIHRLTINRMRAEIQPVSSAEFLRFLLAWQRVAPEHRAEGPEGLLAVLEMLDGYELAAAAWEPEVLALRVKDYEPRWLDQLCFTGRIGWGRLTQPQNQQGRLLAPIRSSPVSIFLREHLPDWLALAPAADAPDLSPDTAHVLRLFLAGGALFFGELLKQRGLLPSRVEQALAELAANGWVTSDSFEGLRALLLPPDKRVPFADHGRKRRHKAVTSVEFAGRWLLLRRPEKGKNSPNQLRLEPLNLASEVGRVCPQRAAEWLQVGSRGALGTDAPYLPGSLPAAAEAPVRDTAIETFARVLLRRYGVVFRRLLEREALAVSWYELGRVYRRLEARGEIRGGHFVGGVGGEQFALPEAIGLLRSVRKIPAEGQLLAISGADPLNLAGILTPGRRVTSIASNRLLLRDGVPIAALEGGEIQRLDSEPKEGDETVQRALRLGSMPALLRPYYA